MPTSRLTSSTATLQNLFEKSRRENMTYVIADICGNYQKFKELMDNVLISDSDTLYILGNTVDFGDEPMELIEDISMRSNVYAVAGARDYLAARMLYGFDKMLKGGTTPDADYIAEMTAWVAEGGQTTLEGFRALDADSREGVIDYLTEMTLYEEATVKGKTYLLLSRGIANYDADTDLEDYAPEDFFAEDATAPQIEDAIVIVGGDVTKSGKIERDGNVIRINCGEKLACLCLETGKEFYV
jgi:serine/threonine protein phosphatase 1